MAETVRPAPVVLPPSPYGSGRRQSSWLSLFALPSLSCLSRKTAEKAQDGTCPSPVVTPTRKPVSLTDGPPSYCDPTSRTAQLLADVFPTSEIAELWHTGGSTAKVHDDATLLFADMVGFTAWSAQHTPDHIFAVLTQYYQLLDNYCEDSGGYKIETVGDCYVASFGIVGASAGTGKATAAAAAIEMGLRIAEVSVHALRKITGDESINMRVGIHTGKICSGIIKSSRPRWQLFGDTINVASRMESTGTPGRVHMSAETYAAAHEAAHEAAAPIAAALAFERVTSAVKGKGTLLTYYVERRGSPSASLERQSSSDERGRFRNSRLAERALMNARSARFSSEVTSSAAAGGRSGAAAGGAAAPPNRLILLISDAVDDLLPICTRFNSAGSSSKELGRQLGQLEVCAVSSALEACRQLAEADVAVVICRASALESPNCGAELVSALADGGNSDRVRILMEDGGLAVDAERAAALSAALGGTILHADTADTARVLPFMATPSSASPRTPSEPTPEPPSGDDGLEAAAAARHPAWTLSWYQTVQRADQIDVEGVIVEVCQQHSPHRYAIRPTRLDSIPDTPVTTAAVDSMSP